MPWEVRNGRGDTVLPNLFYADPSQNEQIMPLALSGSTPQIDRLIYPTLGNPALYVKRDPKDSLTVVLRLENPDAKALKFFLVSRAERDQQGAGTLVTPVKAETRVAPADLPAALRARQTVVATFDALALDPIPAGLYDVRYELGDRVETQPNALRIFDETPENIAAGYTILNVTDTQVSVLASFKEKTLAKLQQFVDFVNTSNDPLVRDAAFITFNGDLHNAGSPESVWSMDVAPNYQNEAAAIMALLKDLRLPIFLTVGNHDGYVATGVVPSFIAKYEQTRGPDFETVVKQALPGSPWPNVSWEKYAAYLEEMNATPGGRHLDLYNGRFKRVGNGLSFSEGWVEVPVEKRNMVLYDGIYQWQKTYGPTHAAWSFGKNLYVNMNSFELRQHMRTGWGMYTVNYGGGVSPEQVAWLSRELSRGQDRGMDITLLAHHDPRGGHYGQDYPYYFDLIEYDGMAVSAQNYVEGELLLPQICSQAPNWAQGQRLYLSCMHDGLQEWMRPDKEFDCEETERNGAGICDPALFVRGAATSSRHRRYSGYEVVAKLAETVPLRTLLLGHTHYNTYEVLQRGDELIPSRFKLDDAASKKYAATEVANPLRGFAKLKSKFLGGEKKERVYKPADLAAAGIIEENGSFSLDLELAGHKLTRELQGAKRELMILRMTSNADLTEQTFGEKPMMGFTAFRVFPVKDKRGYDLPQINEAHYFQNVGSTFSEVARLDIERTLRVRTKSTNNSLKSTFSGKP